LWVNREAYVGTVIQASRRACAARRQGGFYMDPNRATYEASVGVYSYVLQANREASKQCV